MALSSSHKDIGYLKSLALACDTQAQLTALAQLLAAQEEEATGEDVRIWMSAERRAVLQVVAFISRMDARELEEWAVRCHYLT
jgi:hypothetical protein